MKLGNVNKRFAFVDEDVSHRFPVAFNGDYCYLFDIQEVSVSIDFFWIQKEMTVGQIPVVTAFLETAYFIVDP